MPNSAEQRPAQPDVVHHLHALMHTFRVLAQQEDEFCSVLHAVERAGTLRPADTRELERLLGQTPAESLLHDVEAIRSLLRPTLDTPHDAR